MSASAIDFGHELPDQLPTIAAALSAQLALESDLASFLSERAALERDYAAKLQSLVRKYREKKAKRDQDISVGPSPTIEWKHAHSTLSTHIADLYATHDATAADSNTLATGFDAVAGSMTASTKARDELRKKHIAYANKLLSDREKTYADKDKAKAKYDELCHELDSHRQKREKAEAGDKHADRAAKAFQAAEVDMLSAKNNYLIHIAVSNTAKQRFYRTDLPAIQNSLQSLWTFSHSASSPLPSKLSRPLRRTTNSSPQSTAISSPTHRTLSRSKIRHSSLSTTSSDGRSQQDGRSSPASASSTLPKCRPSPPR